ncbi:MAG: EndoU domain-containing protein [Verrucomicrobiales bacterium]|nr:EndoU domain-containing protein [Verrucomicrobiales bacterium]
MEGDGPGLGGGHRPGLGKSGKSEFPSGWSDDRILHEVSDSATDPGLKWSKPDPRGYISATKTVDGVNVKVVVDTKTGRIVTGYPKNTPRNP